MVKKIVEDSAQGSPAFQFRTSTNLSIAEVLDIVNVNLKRIVVHFGAEPQLGAHLESDHGNDFTIDENGIFGIPALSRVRKLDNSAI